MGAWQVALAAAATLVGSAAAGGGPAFSLEMRTLVVYTRGVYKALRWTAVFITPWQSHLCCRTSCSVDKTGQRCYTMKHTRCKRVVFSKSRISFTAVTSTYVPQVYLEGAGVPHDIVSSANVRNVLASGTGYDAIIVADKGVAANMTAGDTMAAIRQYAQRSVAAV